MTKTSGVARRTKQARAFPRTKPVNEHQKKFARALVAGKMGFEAYREAYPRACLWTEKSAMESAAKLLASPPVKEFVKGLQAEANALSILTAQEIVQETRRLALSTPTGIFDKRGKLKKPHQLDAATAAAIASFEIDAWGQVKYKFWDKNSAIERAAKMLGLFEKDNAQKTSPLQSLMVSLEGNVFRPAAIAAQPDEVDDDVDD